MEPNVYASPRDEPLSPKEYQVSLQVPERSVPWGSKLATILSSMGGAALTMWCVVVFFVELEAAAQASVAGVRLSLTPAGHAVFLIFGGIIGLFVGIVVIGVSTITPIKHSRYLLPYLAAAIASVMGLVSRCFVAGLFFAPPRELMDLLFR